MHWDHHSSVPKTGKVSFHSLKLGRSGGRGGRGEKMERGRGGEGEGGEGGGGGGGEAEGVIEVGAAPRASFLGISSLKQG